MTVWTIQPLIVYKQLLQQNRFHCDTHNEDFWGLISEEFKYAYDWLAEQMKLRISNQPEGIKYPIWSWALIDGQNKKPDLRRYEFNNYEGENVILELDISNDDLLLSDEVNWHYVLNNWYLHDINGSEEDIDKTDNWFFSLSICEQNRLKQKSWEKIFDKDDSDNDWLYVQATFWELKIEQITNVRKFTGGKKNFTSHNLRN